MKSSRLLIAGAVAALLPLAAAVAQSPTPEQPAQPAESSGGTTFESLDKDSDGRISKTEAAANPSVTEQFSRYDQNGNGFIEKEEVAATNTPPADTPKQ